ncbi:MAG: energy-coupling factor transporter transmembrane protein EcfT [Anaerolineae bacterium]|nr:energy-coupling factor transporter transmembrane protein EcfT [Anaerolineae bacterium]
MSSLIAYYPGNSLIHRLDPRVKIIFMVIISTALFMVNDISVALVVMLIMLAVWFIARLPFSVLGGFIKVLVPIIGFLFIVQAIFYPGETALIKPLIPIGKGIGQVTLEGILFAVLLSLRLIAMIIMFPMVSFTTPVQNFALGMVKIGLPYTLAYTLTTALNLVPILQTETSVIVDAQRLRAMQSFEKGKMIDKLKSYPALVTPLVIGSMRRAQLMAVAMDSRAFGATKSRTYLEDISMRTVDWIILIGTFVFAIAIVVVSSVL